MIEPSGKERGNGFGISVPIIWISASLWPVAVALVVLSVSDMMRFEDVVRSSCDAECVDCKTINFVTLRFYGDDAEALARLYI